MLNDIVINEITNAYRQYVSHITFKHIFRFVFNLSTLLLAFERSCGIR
jgi:hypothetical protein